MNKNDLVNQVSDNTGLSKSDSAKAVDSVFDSITSTLKSGGDVRLVGFGTFLVSGYILLPNPAAKIIASLMFAMIQQR